MAKKAGNGKGTIAKMPYGAPGGGKNPMSGAVASATKPPKKGK